MRSLISILVIFLIGCTTQFPNMGFANVDRVEQAMSNKQWEVAYRFLEDRFASNVAHTKTNALSLFKNNIEIRTAALQTFSPSSLDKSIERYGASTAWKIERNRLELYLHAASSVDYETAKVNLLSTFADIAKQEADEKRKVDEAAVAKRKIDEELEERLRAEDEKRKAESEAKNARQMEDILQTRRALKIAAADARFVCKDRLECEKAFSLTQIFIISNSDMKIQVANDTVIETYNANDEAKVSVKAIKMPRAGVTSEILLLVNCNDGSKERLRHLCDLKSLNIYSDFPKFIKDNLIK